MADWLEERRSIQRDLATIAAAIDMEISELRQRWPDVRSDLEVWATWCDHTRQRPESREPVIPGADAGISPRLDELQKEMDKLTMLGQLLGKRQEHLASIRSELIPRWSAEHPNTCPTCDAKHEEQIEVVVGKVSEAVASQLGSMREQYARVQAEQRQLRLQIAETGAPPLPKERQIELCRLLGLPWSGNLSLVELLDAEPGAASRFVSSLQRVIAGVELAPPSDPEDSSATAARLMGGVAELDEQGVQMRALPAAWRRIHADVAGLATRIVDAHLPQTLEAVWSELALALSPARWNHQRMPTLDLALERGAQRLQIVCAPVEGSLPARHILNQAEQHVWGLAWFLTRHLSHGRFVVPLVALDDPAQEMDQVTYTRFVRFLQAFARLHRSVGLPLKLVVLLHQEDRAVELARSATPTGRLLVLEWAREMRMKGPDSTVQWLELRNPQQRSPLPRPLWESSEPAAAC